MANQMADLRDDPPEPSQEDRLGSWKEIAAYLKCSERTVRRWEQEGLPVHRHAHKAKASIYAYKGELDAWWRNGHERLKPVEEVLEVPGKVSLRWRDRTWLAVGVALATALALVALLGFNVWGLRQRLVGSPQPRIESLAVLPLENLSHDPDQEYFSDGITDALITDLAQIGSLKVISRTSSMQYKRTKKSLPQIASELHVDGIVEGTVLREGDRVRITAQLLYGPTDRHLWAQSYERSLRDVLALQNEVARAITLEIKVSLTPQEKLRLATARPVNLEAHEAYLKGRFYWNTRNEEGFRKAIEYFNEAIQKDPGYALGYCGLADSYTLLGEYSLVSASEAFPKAREAATKALQLDDALAEAHNALAAVNEDYDWDWSSADREYRRAIELNPGYATAHQWYAELLSELGRHEEALAQIKQARQLDPFSLIISVVDADALRTAGQNDLAIEQLRKILELNPNFAHAHFHLGLTQMRKGAFADAIAEFQKAVTLSPNVIDYEGALGYAYARAGQRAEARKVLTELKDGSKRKYVSWFYIAAVYAGLDEKDQAFACLEKAYQQHEQGFVVIRREPMFDPLLGDPRYKDLLRRINLSVDSEPSPPTHS
jgi:TolB-like protein/Flp pilus assembly protein TadD